MKTDYSKIECPIVFHFRCLSSSMSIAKDILNSLQPYPEEFVIVTDEQSNGIGRNKNAWHSPIGGLWFTYCLKMDTIPSQVTLFLGYCLYETLVNQYPTLRSRLKIKWPNDLYIDNKKVSGILVEKYHDYILAGIGINTNVSDFNLSNLPYAISIEDYLSLKVSHKSILNNLLSNIKSNLPRFVSNGSSDLVSNINENLFGRGKKITIITGNQKITGTLNRVTDDGAIEIIDYRGEITQHISGSIELTR